MSSLILDVLSLEFAMGAFVITLLFCSALASEGRRVKVAGQDEVSEARTTQSFARVLLAYNPAGAFSTSAAAGSARAVQAMRSVRNLPRSAAVDMSGAMSRRSAIGIVAGAAAAAPLAAVAGYSSTASRDQARGRYSGRILGLVGASNEKIIEDEIYFKLFTSGAYGADQVTKETWTLLFALGKKAVASATKGDNAAAQEAIKEFIKTGEIKAVSDDSAYNLGIRLSPGGLYSVPKV